MANLHWRGESRGGAAAALAAVAGTAGALMWARGRRATTAGAALLPALTARDVLAVFARVVLPTLSKGVILRRPRVVALAERLDLDRKAVAALQRLETTYGPGPLLMGPILGRRWAFVLAPEDATRVLRSTPEPFATAALEKRAVLAHFQPRGVLISHGRERAERRALNDAALESGRALHHLAATLAEVVEAEAKTLIAAVSERDGVLTWDDFLPAWFRVVRRALFGDSAREDHRLHQLMTRLRSRANWGWFAPPAPLLRHALVRRIQRRVATADADSVAGAMRPLSPQAQARLADQIPQWLFAFDAAGIATFRTLALLASHPEALQAAQREAAGPASRGLPYLRACVLEAVRLWPTTPVVLRETTEETVWSGGVMPGHTGVVIFSPFFHRDRRRLEGADRFVPELWLEGRPEDLAIVPFSDGPAACPGRPLVLLLSTAMLAALIRRHDLAPESGRLNPHLLPGTLSHFGLRFRLAAKPSQL